MEEQNSHKQVSACNGVHMSHCSAHSNFCDGISRNKHPATPSQKATNLTATPLVFPAFYVLLLLRRNYDSNSHPILRTLIDDEYDCAWCGIYWGFVGGTSPVHKFQSAIVCL
eukprot:132635-Amphidinium_carterae.1